MNFLALAAGIGAGLFLTESTGYQTMRERVVETQPGFGADDLVDAAVIAGTVLLVLWGLHKAGIARR